jgi:hypothetical protein
MRVRHFGAALAAIAVAGLSSASAFGHALPSWNDPVKITNGGCVVGYPAVDHQFTRIVFGVYNNGTVAHGFDISAKYKTGLIKPHEEKTLIADFGRAGGYKWACVARNSTVKKGIFTIR